MTKTNKHHIDISIKSISIKPAHHFLPAGRSPPPLSPRYVGLKTRHPGSWNDCDGGPRDGFAWHLPLVAVSAEFAAVDGSDGWG